MTVDPLPALASAAEGSRELDCMIEKLLGDKSRCTQDASLEVLLAPSSFGVSGVADWCDGSEEVFQYLPETNADAMGIPHYTTSTDAALTLVPEGAVLSTTSGGRDGGAVATVAVFRIEPLGGRTELVMNDFASNEDGNSRPLALAICLASLRAREAAP